MAAVNQCRPISLLLLQTMMTLTTSSQLQMLLTLLMMSSVWLSKKIPVLDENLRACLFLCPVLSY